MRAVIGLGICTYNRPEFFATCVSSVVEHLLPIASIWVNEDHSDEQYRARYDEIFDSLPPSVKVRRSEENQGVCRAKNSLLQSMMDAGCQHLFLLEDDQEILSRGAVNEYIRYSQISGIEHMMFAHHGPANVGRLVDVDPSGIELYLNCVGAYCYYTRNAIETVGLLPERYDKNCWEHVVHYADLARAGLCPAFWRFPDIPNSRSLIREQPGGIDSSAIRQGPEWPRIVEEGRRVFASEYPEVWT